MDSAPLALPRAFFDRPVLEVAPDLLGRVLVHAAPTGTVAVRITEVEAYAGADDPASHCFRGPTARNAVMFGPPGHAYVYFTYGMHWCVNLVCGPEGVASAVLLRAGEVVSGVETARLRRPPARTDRDLARGPACLTQALALDGSHNGLDVCDAGSLTVLDGPGRGRATMLTGPRVGVRTAATRPWRFWSAGEPSVSAYRPAAPRPRTEGRPGRVG
jgi:DNA-3-methyladenine glycosylase